jgi:hypothetical protein
MTFGKSDCMRVPLPAARMTATRPRPVLPWFAWAAEAFELWVLVISALIIWMSSDE